MLFSQSKTFLSKSKWILAIMWARFFPMNFHHIFRKSMLLKLCQMFRKAWTGPHWSGSVDFNTINSNCPLCLHLPPIPAVLQSRKVSTNLCFETLCQNNKKQWSKIRWKFIWHSYPTNRREKKGKMVQGCQEEGVKNAKLLVKWGLSLKGREC